MVIKGASLMAVKVVEYLAKNWTKGVDLYSVNVPLIEGIEGEGTKVLYTNMLQNYWDTGSSFEEVEGEEILSPEQSEAEIREGVHGEQEDGKVVKVEEKSGYVHKRFKWAPKLDGAFASVDRVSFDLCFGGGLVLIDRCSRSRAMMDGLLNRVMSGLWMIDSWDGGHLLTRMDSITPLKANFMHHPGDLIGQEVKL